MWLQTQITTETPLNEYKLKKIYCVQKKSSKEPILTPPNFPLKRISPDATEVWFCLTQPIVPDKLPLVRRNAYDLLMKEKYITIIHKDPSNQKNIMYNDVVEIFGGKFPKDSQVVGKELVELVVECLWAIDSNSGKFMTASINGNCKRLPTYFKSIFEKNYRKWQKQKVARPSLKEDILQKCSNALFDKLSLFDQKRKYNEMFFTSCKELAESLRSYADYLKKALARVNENNERVEDTLNEFLFTPTDAILRVNLKDSYVETNN